MPVGDLSVVIATCDRAAVLLQTIDQLLCLDTPPMEIIVVDQSAVIDDVSRSALEAHDQQGNINWIRRTRRSIPAAMNHGLLVANAGVVLFLDDDVRIECELVAAHAAAHAREGVEMVVGQVIQPWQQPLGDDEPEYHRGKANDPDAFRFNATRGQKVRRFMGGNVSVRRSAVIELGGFDENFVGAAYRFEAEFSQRFCDRGFEIYFEPAACIYHLKAPHGGTRGFGQYLAPWHSTGRYYYWLSFPRIPGLFRNTLFEALQCTIGRRHLRTPWLVIPSACAELSGFMLAIYHRLRGPRLPLGNSR
jgi:GT2 family glycosyltransferase